MMLEEPDILNFFGSSFHQILSVTDLDIMTIGYSVPFPSFDEDMLNNLCNISIQRLKAMKTVEYIQSPCVIVGDIHGSFHDLIRIFSICGGPIGTKYLFLGDYVDRGNFSLECIVLLLYLNAIYPERIFLLRGNHECRKINGGYGFKAELSRSYSEALWEKFNEVFDYLPLSVIIDDSIICLHGGISPDFTKISQLSSIERPIRDPDQFIDAILWSDPSKTFHNFSENERGKGCIFGAIALQTFLEENNLSALVRAHQCVMHGIQTQLNGMCITVFSCSNYHDNVNNDSGIIRCISKNIMKPLQFPPLKKMKREEASFFTSKYTSSMKPNELQKVLNTQLVRLHSLNKAGSGCMSFRMKPPVSNRKKSLTPHNRVHLLPKLFTNGAIKIDDNDG